jgi:hypothetical protein
VLGVAWFQLSPGEAPPGQSPLVTLGSESLQDLRADFNHDTTLARIIVLLSLLEGPVCGGASVVESLLQKRMNGPIRVYAVWQPMLPTDWSAPSGSVLGRLSDSRVRQYWDPNHVLATQMKRDARPPQPMQDCCVRSEILWDLAAVYPPGAAWSDRMPTATLFNGPVVEVTDAIEEALTALAKKSN